MNPIKIPQFKPTSIEEKELWDQAQSARDAMK
jgi:hypothetical protein